MDRTLKIKSIVGGGDGAIDAGWLRALAALLEDLVLLLVPTRWTTAICGSVPGYLTLSSVLHRCCNAHCKLACKPTGAKEMAQHMNVFSQARQPEFNPWNPQDGGRKFIL